MARPVRKQFRSANEGTLPVAPVVANDEALLKKAQDTVRVKQEVSRQNLLHLQGLEIKHLENERKFIGQEKAKDVTPFNTKEIAAINQRYDRLVHRMERSHNSFLGKVSRVFGGHKRQQRQITRINTERDAVVTERTKQHVRSEAQRQRSLSQHDLKVESDLQQAREKHAEAREKQRHAHEHGFENAVKLEVQRMQHVQKPRVSM
jgi:hypothetical protein